MSITIDGSANTIVGSGVYTLTSPTLVTPALGTPASGTLDNCTSNTETAANNSTQLATTAYADRLTAGTLAGAFTTLSASGNISAGGAISSSWSANSAIEVTYPGCGLWAGGSSSITLVSNYYYNAGDKFAGTGYAMYSNLVSGDGSYRYYISTASGTAGGAATMAEHMRLSSTGLAVTGTITGSTTIGVGNATPAASGAGITFPATQSASSDANTLDDYEEGTWTPAVSINTGTATTYSVLAGTYTKIGDMVTIWGKVRPSNGTVIDMIITGIPFTAGTTQQEAGSALNTSTYDNGGQSSVYSTNLYVHLSGAVTNQIVGISCSYKV